MGCVFFDYDHDGEWDLYIVNDYQFAPLPNILYHGNGDNTFTPVSGGDATLEHTYSDYGLAMGDLDRDETFDLVIATSKNGNATGIGLLRNDASEGHWLQVKLTGTVSNRDCVGARATLHYDGNIRMDEGTLDRDTPVRAPLTFTGVWAKAQPSTHWSSIGPTAAPKPISTWRWTRGTN